MPKQRVVKSSFNAGEFSSRLYGRIDIEKYANGCKTMKNMMSMPHGGATRRPGFEYIAATKNADESNRLIPFTYSTDQAYIIEAGPLYMRFFMNGGQVQTVDSNTDLLLHCDGDNAATTFTDSGDTGHTITANGNAKIDTSQYKFGTGALRTSAAGDYLSVPDHADFNFGAAEFTIDFWVRFNTAEGMRCLYYQGDTATYDHIALFYDFETSRFYFMAMDGEPVISEIMGGDIQSALEADTWYHVALIRGWGGDTDDWALVLNGGTAFTFTLGITLPDHDQVVQIGDCDLTHIIDFGNTHHEVTVAGNTTIEEGTSKFGRGSIKFDGVGDCLYTEDEVDWDIFNQTNFTIDLWVKHDSAGDEVYITQYEDASNYWRLYHNGALGVKFEVQSGGGSMIPTLVGPEITDTNWHHVAIAKVSNEYGLYVDGVQVDYVQDSDTDTYAGSLYTGQDGAGGTYFSGYMQNIRIDYQNVFSAAPDNLDSDTITVPTENPTRSVSTKYLIYGEPKDADAWFDEYRVSKGVARWTAAFTPPASEYPAGDDSGTAYEIVTPYTEDELPYLRYVQSADVLYIGSPDRGPRKLSRTAHTSWTLTEFSYDSDNWPAFLDINATSTTLTAGSTTGTSLALTASASLFDADHVGAHFAFNSGYVEVTGVSSATTATCDVVDTLTAAGPTADWYESAWSDYQGWPTALTFYEDRSCFSGTAKNPDRIELSVTGEYENFKRGELDASSSATASDGLAITLASRQVNAVRWLGSTRKLIAGTSGAEWWIDGKDSQSAIDATELPRARNDSEYGSARVAPLFIGNTIFFCQRLNKVIRAYGYDWETDQYVGRDMSIIAEHLTNFGTISELAWQQTPHQIVWALRSDGVLLGLTYMREHQVEGWHWHESGGTDAKIKSIAVIEGAAEDELWVITERTIDGATARYVERMAPLVQIDTGQGGSSDWTLEDAFFVDSGLTYRGAAATSISGLDHLEGEDVVALADGTAVGSLTVTSGAITLSSAASVVHVGLNYQSDLEPLWPVVQDELGAAVGVAQRIPQVNLLLYKSSGAKYGPDEDNLVPIDYAEGDWEEGSAGAYYTGMTGNLSVDGGYDGDPTPYIRQDEPLPLAVLAAIMEIEV